MSKGFLHDSQEALFGHGGVIGFGCDLFSVQEVGRDEANRVIKANHYSKKYYNASYIHLGVFMGQEMVGVLQYGYAMNPASCGSVVDGTEMNQYLELNRMWLSDCAPRNSESRAISYSIKYIKRKYPRIKWIQSFADQRCGGFGIVYQACSFSYYGEHTSTFWELDGEVYHNSIMTDSHKAETPKGRKLLANRDRALRHELRQFRYIKFIDMSWKKKCKLKEQPYIKHYKENAA